MREAAAAGRGVQDLVGSRPRERNEFLDRLHRQRWMHYEQTSLRREQAHADEILERVIRQLLVDVRVADVGRGMDHEGVAVGLGLGDQFGADGARSAGPVVDDELLSSRLGDFLENDAPHDVGEAAARPWCYHAHRLAGIDLGHRGRRHDRSPRHGSECGCKFGESHDFYPFNREKAVHRKGRQGREGKQSTSLLSPRFSPNSTASNEFIMNAQQILFLAACRRAKSDRLLKLPPCPHRRQALADDRRRDSIAAQA
jgi:hypothetical protein